MSTAPELPDELLHQVDELVDDARSSCLWYLRLDYMPRTAAEIDSVLRAIANHGDRATFQRARMLQLWLSRLTSEESVAS